MRLPRLRFRIRTMAILIAVIALGIFAIPRLIWRFQVNRALESALSQGPELGWSYDLLHAQRQDEFLYLASDRIRVADDLLQVIARGGDDARGMNAVQTLAALFRQPGALVARRRCLDRLLDLAARSQVSPLVEREITRNFDYQAAILGLDRRQRQLMLARARSAPPFLLPGWVHLLAAIGGREETRFVAGLGGSHDPEILTAVHLSFFARSRWPGLLPYLKTWLADPVVAPYVMRHGLLSHTPAGRPLLIAFATDASHPLELRQKAIERLNETVAGTELLQKAIADPATRATLCEAMGGTPQASLQAAMAKLAACNGDDFWVELIDGLDAAPPIPTAHPPTEIEKRVSEAMSAADARGRESRLKCLGWLTRRSDIRTSEEWHEWLHQTRPPPLAQRSLLAFVLAHPDALEHGVFLRRVVPHHLGTIPDDCVPLYERMVREGSPTGRHFACMALLLYTDKTDSVPVTIDLIEEGQRGNLAASSDWGPIDLLRTRFAVNYFWDTDAWRDWWAGNHDK